MVIYPKKLCFLHFSHTAASSSKPNCIYNLCSKSGQKLGTEFDHLQVSVKIISWKKPDPENPGKIQIWNFWILRSDFKNGQYLVLVYKEILKLFCNFGKFWQLSHWEYLGYMQEFFKYQPDMYFLHNLDLWESIIENKKKYYGGLIPSVPRSPLKGTSLLWIIRLRFLLESGDLSTLFFIKNF